MFSTWCKFVTLVFCYMNPSSTAKVMEVPDMRLAPITKGEGCLVEWKSSRMLTVFDKSHVGKSMSPQRLRKFGINENGDGPLHK